MSTTRPQPSRERIRSSSPASSRRAAVGGDHDLPAAIDQRIEGVEELLLGGLLAADELDVVDHQHVGRAEQLLEAHGVLEAQRLDELVHELLGGQVDHLARRVLAADLPGDGVHQVGLAEPDAAVQEQRVERRRGRSRRRAWRRRTPARWAGRRRSSRTCSADRAARRCRASAAGAVARGAWTGAGADAAGWPWHDGRRRWRRRHRRSTPPR